MISFCGWRLRAHRLGDRRKIWPGLHLDDSVAFVIEHAHIARALQKRPVGADRFLVVEHRAIGQERRNILRGEAVVEQIGILRMLVMDDIGDHHVADAPVERSGLAHDVDTEQA